MISSRARVSQPVGRSTDRQPGNPIDQQGVVKKKATDARITLFDLSIAKAQSALACLRG
jgi:hypothetical protein